jgi:hypothetical protein
VSKKNRKKGTSTSKSHIRNKQSSRRSGSRSRNSSNLNSRPALRGQAADKQREGREKKKKRSVFPSGHYLCEMAGNALRKKDRGSKRTRGINLKKRERIDNKQKT